MTRKTIPWHGMGGEGGEKGVRPTIQPAQYIYWKCNSVTRYLLIYFMSEPVHCSVKLLLYISKKILEAQFSIYLLGNLIKCSKTLYLINFNPG